MLQPGASSATGWRGQEQEQEQQGLELEQLLAPRSEELVVEYSDDRCLFRHRLTLTEPQRRNSLG